jgi:predicted PurR-regulated permease PerM
VTTAPPRKVELTENTLLPSDAIETFPPQRPLIHGNIWPRLDPILKRYFIGVIVVVSYAAAPSYIGLGIALRLPHAVFLALLTGVLEAIPVVGPVAAAIIAGLVAIHHATGFDAIIAYAVYLAALRLSIDQLFGPLALGVAARAHPVLIIFCLQAGGVVFGIAGMIMAVPLALTIKITLATLYDEPQGPEQITQRKLAK